MTFCGALAKVTVVPSSPVTLTDPDVGDAAVVGIAVVAMGEAVAVGAAVGVWVGAAVGGAGVAGVVVAGGWGDGVGPPVPWQAVIRNTATATNENPFALA